MSRADVHRVADMLMAAEEMASIVVRDRLSHHYHRVDPNQLWTMASVDVPAVGLQLRALDSER